MTDEKPAPAAPLTDQRSQPIDGRVSDRGGPIPLTEEQQTIIKAWAADDRLWTTQETVEINLRTFARVILKAAHATQQAALRALPRYALSWDTATAAPKVWPHPEGRFVEFDELARLLGAAPGDPK